jgi:hypothetical protein
MDKSSNIRLAWVFNTDDAEITFFTSESGNMKAYWVCTPQPVKKWRSATYPIGEVPDQIFEFAYTRKNFSSFICIYNYNLTKRATITKQLANDPNFNEILFEQTWKAHAPVYGLGEGLLGLQGLGGYSTENIVMPFSIYWHDNVLALYERIILSDANNENGFIEAGRIASGSYWSPLINIDPESYSLKWETTSEQTRIKHSAVLRTQKNKQYREITVNFKWLTSIEENKLHEMIRQVDNGGNVLVTVFPLDKTTNAIYHSGLFFLRSWSSFDRNTPFRKFNLTFTEAI